MISFREWLKARIVEDGFTVSPSVVDDEMPIVDGGVNKGAFPFYSKKEMPPQKKKNCGCKSKKLSKKK